MDFRFTLLAAMFLAVDRVAECARRALPNCVDDFIDIRLVRMDPRLGPLPHGRTTGRAESGMRTDAPIVEDRDILTLVRVALVWNAPLPFLI